MKSEKEFVKVLSTINASGYEGLQIEYNLLPRPLLKNPDRLRSLVGDSSLELVGVAVSSNPYEMRFTHEAGGKVGTLCLFEKKFNDALKQTKALLKQCRKFDLKLAVHPHVKSNIQTIQQVEQLLKACNDKNLTLVFDSAHFTALGWDLNNFLTRFHEKISVVHLKDLRRLVSPDEISYDHDFVDIGDGVIDFERLFNGFKQVHYAGWLIMEVDHSQQNNPEFSVRKNFKSLSSLI